jgi:hypothetical protein
MLKRNYSMFPNPVNDYIECSVNVDRLSFVTMTGTKLPLRQVNQNRWDATHIAPGFYVGVAEVNGRVVYFKIIKH